MLHDLLRKNKEIVLGRWYEHLLDTYPDETKRFLRSQKDRFANPVGAAISEGLEGIYEAIAEGENLSSERLVEFLDRIVRVRAVQEFSPGESLEFVFGLKKAIREGLRAHLTDMSLVEELLTLESRIDKLVLLSFDLYMHCRETIFENRCREIRHSTERLWERICRKYGNPEEWSDTPDNDSSLR